MAKMRGFKPEIWTDEKFVALQPLARLLFMGMWSYACDNGHLEDRPSQIKMRVLPADSCNVSELLDEIVKQGMATRIDGVITIPKLRVHQRLDKRYFTTCAHCEPDGDTPCAPRDHAQGAAQKEGRKGDEGEGERKSAPKGATRIPDGFAVTDPMRDWAEKNNFGHLDLDALTEEFVDFWRGATKNATKADWIATWRNRIRAVADSKPHLRLAANRGQQPEGW